MFRRNRLNKLTNKTLNKICFVLSIAGLIFIFITLCRYRHNAFIEDYENMCIENLENEKDKADKTDKKPDKPIDSRQNITTQPSPPTEDELKSPGYLELTSLSVPNVKNFVLRTFEHGLKSIRPDVQGPPGLMGPSGVKGDSGGTYTHRGPMRFVNNPNLFLGRNTNKLLIGNRTHKPDQTWTLDSGGKLINQAGGCLTATDNGDLEVIDNCITAEKWSYIGKNSQLRTTKPIKGGNKCLTMKPTPENGKDGQYTLSLEKCVVGPDQAWSFH